MALIGCTPSPKSYGIAFSNSTTNTLDNVYVSWDGRSVGVGTLGTDPRVAVVATVYPVRGSLPTNAVVSFRTPDGVTNKVAVTISQEVLQKVRQSDDDLSFVIHADGKITARSGR
jgi:hypothetical protein